MKIWVWAICLVLAVAIGAFFVLQGVERGEPAAKPPEATKQAGGESDGRKPFSHTPLSEPLNPNWPEEIAPVRNPCANLQVPENIKRAALGLGEQKEKAELVKQKVLAERQLPAEISRGNANKKAVALTIDTGTGGADGIEQILELGRHYGISFTFFLTGCWVLENPELTQQIVREGHGIANHTLTHLNLASASDAQARREIEEARRILEEVVGWKPALFRKPQYAGGERITSLLAEYTMISVQGYPDFGDTTGWRPGTTSQQVEALVKRKTAPGAIWVLHNLSLADLGALEEIIRFHIIEGYTIVPVEEMLP
ncbi:MAG TPA: polysaccharide deacetylase family protein [Candidatus Paceibacterota bacterium]